MYVSTYVYMRKPVDTARTSIYILKYTRICICILHIHAYMYMYFVFTFIDVTSCVYIYIRH